MTSVFGDDMDTMYAAGQPSASSSSKPKAKTAKTRGAAPAKEAKSAKAKGQAKPTPPAKKRQPKKQPEPEEDGEETEGEDEETAADIEEEEEEEKAPQTKKGTKRQRLEVKENKKGGASSHNKRAAAKKVSNVAAEAIATALTTAEELYENPECVTIPRYLMVLLTTWPVTVTSQLATKRNSGEVPAKTQITTNLEVLLDVSNVSFSQLHYAGDLSNLLFIPLRQLYKIMDIKTADELKANKNLPNYEIPAVELDPEQEFRAMARRRSFFRVTDLLAKGIPSDKARASATIQSLTGLTAALKTMVDCMSPHSGSTGLYLAVLRLLLKISGIRPIRQAIEEVANDVAASAATNVALPAAPVSVPAAVFVPARIPALPHQQAPVVRAAPTVAKAAPKSIAAKIVADSKKVPPPPPKTTVVQAPPAAPAFAAAVKSKLKLPPPATTTAKKPVVAQVPESQTVAHKPAKPDGKEAKYPPPPPKQPEPAVEPAVPSPTETVAPAAADTPLAATDSAATTPVAATNGHPASQIEATAPTAEELAEVASSTASSSTSTPVPAVATTTTVAVAATEDTNADEAMQAALTNMAD